MKQTRGARKQLTNSRACIFVLEGEQKSYIDALAAGGLIKDKIISQSEVVRTMINYFADTHKI